MIALAWPDRWLGDALLAFTALWLFGFGATWGSFLNVVAYRLPLGKNLSWPPSSCPRCGTRIARGDNVPVLGWLRLRGKCRACGLPISGRYPFVEALAGAAFVGLAFLELSTDGANLPHRMPHWGRSGIYAVWMPAPELLRVFAAHSVLLFALVALGSVGWDGARLSAWGCWRWMGIPFVAACGAWPELMPVRLAWALPGWSAPAFALGGSLVGAVAGRWLFPANAAAAALVLVGTYLGPFAVLPVGLAARAAPPRRAAAAAAVVAAAYVSFWRPADGANWLPNPHSETAVWAAWIAAAAAAGGIARKFQARGPANESPPA